MKIRRFLSIVLTVVLIIGLMPSNLICRSVHADSEQEGIAYIDENGEEKVCYDYKIVTNNDTAWTDGWYVVTQDFIINNNIMVTGEVHLIICNNKAIGNNASGTFGDKKRITISDGARLSVYSQSIDESEMGVFAYNDSMRLMDSAEFKLNSGKIYLNGPLNLLGDYTSGQKVIINGGIVCNNNSIEDNAIILRGTDQELIINGGVVNVPLMVFGNQQSSYGSNTEMTGGVNCKIIINDGVINITHGTNSDGYDSDRDVGIGFRWKTVGGELIINGGIINIDSYCINNNTITYRNYELYPVIGIGFYDSCKDGIITINGGTINTKGTIGIGFSEKCDDGSLIINHGDITATGCDMGIGFTSNCQNGVLTINGGHVVASSKWDSGVGIGVGRSRNYGQGTQNNFDINLNGGIISSYPDISFEGNCGIGLSRDSCESNAKNDININISNDIIVAA